MKNANESVSEVMVLGYVKRVEEYVELIHGQKGLKEMTKDPILYMREYNEKYSMTVEKYLMMPEKARKTLESAMMKNVYDKINENEAAT